jgi:molybdate transport system permease protein
VRRRPAAIPFLAAILAVYLLAPFVAGLAQAGLADWAGTDRTALIHAAFISVTSATISALIIALLGIPFGYLLAHGRSRKIALLGWLAQLPLALPPLASGILLLFLFGYASPLGRLTGGALTDSFAGIVLAETFVAAPFLIIAARSAFLAVDPVLEEVAATLGHGPRAVFFRVSLPLAWRTILAGLLLAWLRAFGEFGATIMVAYHPYSLPIYTYVAFGSQGLPAMLPVLVPTLLAAGAVMAASVLLHRQRSWRAPRAAPIPPVAGAPVPVLPQAPFAFAFTRQRDGFRLDAAWEPKARHLAILGPSGSGKSATLRLLAGLDTPDSGFFDFAGRAMAELPPEQRRIGYVPQSYGLMPHLRVAEQIQFANGFDPRAAQHWRERLGLGPLAHRYPAELSLGQQQRVALARALASNAGLLLLDEPFSALDSGQRARLRHELQALQNEIPATTILVTHDPAEAMMLADELLLLDDGAVLQSGRADSVYARPANAVAAKLLGAGNIAHGEAVSPHMLAIGGGIMLAVPGPPLTPGHAGWAIRPERIRVARDGAYPATVTAIGPARGGQQLVTVQLGDAVLAMAVAPGAEIALGPARIDLDSSALQVWAA